ncbi:MAG: voltage-gated chloride channel protein, partial [Arachidicoccus sp.]
MKKIKSSFEHITILRHLLKWSLIAIPVAAIIGSVVALFLWLLETATSFRWAHPWLLFLLPIAGVLIYFSYKLSGKNAEAGNNLIIDEIHKPGAG